MDMRSRAQQPGNCAGERSRISLVVELREYLFERLLIPAGELAPLIQDAEGARRGRHEKSIAARDQALDVVRIGMRMAARHVVLFADRQNAVDLLGYDWVFIVARMA